MRVDTGVLHSSRSGVVVKTSSSVPSTLRFGVFELDPRAGELRKKGMKIRLQGQPVEILVMLLEHPGETLNREELQRKLWPADTFVDFEQGLNNAIKRLRAALDDDAESPHFIETLPRHGYRFIGSEHARAEGTKATHSTGSLMKVPAIGVLAVLAVAAVLVGLNVRGWRDRLFVRTPKPQIQALAVLPLANLSGDPTQEYFADGMTEELITDLAKIGALRVISRTSTMQYKGAHKPLPEVARALNVDAVVEGSVEGSGNRVRIRAQLIEASTDRHLWAESYERDLRDVLGLQSEVARAIAHEIKIKLTPQHPKRLAAARPLNSRAYELYLKGRYYWNKMSGVAVTQAAEYFSKAIALDGSYAPVYVGLADCYVSQADLGNLPPGEAYGRGREGTLKALEIDHELKNAHA